jgi:hypothetical protein
MHLNLKEVDVFSFHLQIFHWLSLRLRADISKVTPHERIQQGYSRETSDENFVIQGVIESCTDILTTSYWLHVELGKNI